MKVLGVDTSSRKGSVAMVSDAGVSDEITSDSAESFSRSLLVMIDSILKRNSTRLDAISGIGIAIGPGSFTGIRIGLSTILGLEISRQIPVFGVSTLESMFFSTTLAGDVLVPTLDAGMGSLYYAAFTRTESGAVERKMEDGVAPVEDVIAKAKKAVLFGEGASRYAGTMAMLGTRYEEGIMKSSPATGVAGITLMKMKLGEKANPLSLKPNYIRRGPVNVPDV